MFAPPGEKVEFGDVEGLAGVGDGEIVPGGRRGHTCLRESASVRVPTDSRMDCRREPDRGCSIPRWSAERSRRTQWQGGAPFAWVGSLSKREFTPAQSNCGKDRTGGWDGAGGVLREEHRRCHRDEWADDRYHSGRPDSVTEVRSDWGGILQIGRTVSRRVSDRSGPREMTTIGGRAGRLTRGPGGTVDACGRAGAPGAGRGLPGPGGGSRDSRQRRRIGIMLQHEPI